MAEPLKATFFALKRRDRAVLLPATVIYAIIAGLIIAAFLALNWGTLTNFFALIREQPDALSDEEGLRIFAGMMGIFGWLFLLLFPFYIATAAYEAACLRWMIRGEAPGLFGLTLNADTWRVWGVYWAWMLTQWVVGFVVSILTFPFMFMMMGDIMAQGGSTEPDSAAMMELQLKTQALSFLQYIPLAFLGIRLGPAAATSIARKQFSFFEAWNVTRDRFFALFGSYALLWVIFAIAYGALAIAAYYPVFGQFFGDTIGAWPNVPAEETFDRYMEIFFSPTSWINIGAGYAGALVLSLIYSLLSYGINARAVLAAIEEGKTTVPEQTHG